ncbi:GIY-YIG nuclease family protein [Prosthecochloris sp. SCSIO W1103]|uniref:GIY-YIG nuclease family protein n=1 Tax=Prosthecochloris sp. SCSIO W1103 TaxID=2992244 RepID=UPI00223E232F|nr:GIY-YIG nuclease family protein [Prosthecochloris sp. SCSIO W1103]UZJ37783.1 GIY-YIG nuclease family protein [Prosthecochloris sp. SCSIO W1103]
MRCIFWDREARNVYYVGVSSDPTRCLEFHNSQETRFTARYRPWKMIFMKRYPGRSEALAIERRIKSWESKLMIARIVSGEIKI